MEGGAAVLLEHLAATGWFVKHGEIALTGGLAFCLAKDPAAAAAFVQLLRERTHLSTDDLPADVRWHAEEVDEKGGRIDVAGWVDTDGAPAPVVFIEGKVSADFLQRQVSDYTVTQQEKLAGARRDRGTLVVLAPEIRVRPVRAEVEADLKRLGAVAQEQSWRVEGQAAIVVTVVSWDEALEAMLGPAEQAACDLEQLWGACRALQGADVTAFTDAELAGGWRHRKEKLELVIDRVTREASAQLSIPPLPKCAAFAGLQEGYRYIGEAGLPNLAVGTRLDGTPPPFWVRWHSRTADVELAETRLTGAGHTVQRNTDGLWLPLDLEPDTGPATRQIARLVTQVVVLYKIAVGRPELS